MKKIIAAIDSLKYSETAVAYAVNLAKQTNAHLVGIFLDDFTYHSYEPFEVVSANENGRKKIRELEKKEKALRSESVKRFEAACASQKIKYSIHHDKNIAIQELLHETVYADLLIIDKKETLTSFTESVPTRFMKDLLSDVQCPVIIISGKYEPIRKAIFLYDGEPSSVHALKMFGYLFPFGKLKMELLSIKSSNHSLEPPNNKMIKEFMKHHFPLAKFTVLTGIAEVEILRQLKKIDPSILVILGAYRRGRVSRWFRESMADVLMKNLQSPLFIAHNK